MAEGCRLTLSSGGGLRGWSIVAVWGNSSGFLILSRPGLHKVISIYIRLSGVMRGSAQPINSFRPAARAPSAPTPKTRRACKLFDCIAYYTHVDTT
jgi:hypothetical protein